MYPVSEDYINTVWNTSVQTSYRGLITTDHGIPFHISGKDIVQGSGTVTRQICNGEDIEIGTVCSSSLDISLYLDVARDLLYKAKVQMWFQLMLPNGTQEEVPLGNFYVVEPPDRSINVLTIHAYDKMYKFDRDITALPQGEPYNILSYICGACGVELGTTQEYIASCPNGLTPTYCYKDANILTYRDMISHLAAYLGCFAFIGVDDKLYFKRYSMDKDRTIHASERYEYIPTEYETYYSVLTSEFLITQETEKVSIDGNGLTYEFGANAFAQIDDNDQRKQVLLAILNQLYGVRYTPFTARVPCDPSLMIGDVVEFVDNHAIVDRVSAITKQVITIGGSMTLECTGRDPMLELKTATEKAIAGVSKSKADDTLHYYDFVNEQGIHVVANARRMRLFQVEYVTTKSTHVDFHAQIAMEVENKEEIAEDFTSTVEYDGIVKITYALADEEIVDFYPTETFMDGKHTLDLMYSFWASGNQRSTFTVYLECIDCSLDIPVGHARGYMCGQGLVGDDAWDGAVHIYDDFTPFKFSMIRKQFTDSVNISKHVPTGDSVSQRFTKLNISNILKQMHEGLLGNDLIHYDVLYSDNIVTKNNIQIVNGSWKIQNTDQLGFVTTANEHASRILKVTSKHSGDDVAYIVSFDGGTTWWTYANGWVEPDYSQDVYGMFEGTMRSITAAQWDEKLSVTGTIMIQAILIAEGSTLTDIQIFTSELSDWKTIEPSDVTNYNSRYVDIDHNAVELIYEYSATSNAGSIDSGTLEEIEIENNDYSVINQITVY